VANGGVGYMGTQGKVELKGFTFATNKK